MSISARLAWNTALAWIRNLITAGTAFLLVRYQIAYLGQDGYGTVEVVASIILFASFADVGLKVALSQQIAREVALKNWERVNEYFNSALLVYFALAGCAAVVFMAGAPYLVQYFEIPPQIYQQATVLVRFYLPIVLLSYFITPAYGGLLESYHRFDIQEYIHISESLVRAAVILVLLWAGMGVYGWAIGMLAGRSVSLSCLSLFGHRTCPELRLSPAFAKRTALHALYAVGIYLVLQKLVIQANVVADPLIIARFFGPDGVAIYKPALLVVTATSSFVWGLSRQLRPLVIGLEVSGAKEQVREVASRGTRVTFLAGIPFTILVACFAHQVVQVWLPDLPSSSLRITGWVLVLLSIWSLATHIRSSQSYVLMGLSRIKFASLVQLAATSVGLACSIALIALLRARGWGMESVIGAAIPSIAVGYLQVVFLGMYIGMRTGAQAEYWKDSFIRPTFVLLITGATGIALSRFTSASIVAILVSAAATGCVWLASTWFLGFDAIDRRRVRTAISRSAGKFRRSSSLETADSDPESAVPTPERDIGREAWEAREV